MADSSKFERFPLSAASRRRPLHGVVGSLIRALQEAASYEREHARRYADHLQRAGYVLGVFVGVDKDAKQRAADAMREHGGDFVNYYADTYVESL